MKLFGNSKPHKMTPPREELPDIPAPEQVKEFELSGQDFDVKLKLLLNDEELVSPEQIETAPPKEMGKPINTDYHIVHDPIRGTRVQCEEEEEEEDAGRAGMSGVIKGSLLLLTSVVILILVLFGVYINLF